jgi:hypothetical protein
VTHPNGPGVRLCSACRGDYEDPDALPIEEEPATPEDEEKPASDRDEVSCLTRVMFRHARMGEGARKGEARRIGRCGESQLGESQEYVQ